VCSFADGAQEARRAPAAIARPHFLAAAEKREHNCSHEQRRGCGSKLPCLRPWAVRDGGGFRAKVAEEAVSHSFGEQ